MYILTIEDHFAAAHQLIGYKGKCENLHGHNWKVVVSVKGEVLNDIGLLIDFRDLKAMLGQIINFLDHKNINELPPFTRQNPSSENIARFISEKLAMELQKSAPQVQVDSVTVWESDTSRCTFIF